MPGRATAYFDISLAGASIGRLVFYPVSPAIIYPGGERAASSPAGPAAGDQELDRAETGGVTLGDDDLKAWGTQLATAFETFCSLCRSRQNGRSLFFGARVEEVLQDCWIRFHISQDGNCWDSPLKHTLLAVKPLPFPVFRPAVPPLPESCAATRERCAKSHDSAGRQRYSDPTSGSVSPKPRAEVPQTIPPAEAGADCGIHKANTTAEGLAVGPVQSPTRRLNLAQCPCLARRGVVMCDASGSNLYLALGDLPWLDPREYLPLAQVSVRSDVLKRIESRATLTGYVENEILVVGTGRSEPGLGRDD